MKPGKIAWWRIFHCSVVRACDLGGIANNQRNFSHDFVLANAIKLAAYTGARREGICTLKVSSLLTDPDTKIRFLHLSEKTRAGKRDVPVHSAIAGLIDELSK